MKLSLILQVSVTLVCGACIVDGSEQTNDSFPVQRAVTCQSDACRLPNCRCSGLPLLRPEFESKEKSIPQFVTVTFDDAVTSLNYAIYEKLFAGLKNYDQCTSLGTFFVTHEWTDYSKVHALYAQGHEIALHSVSHGTGTQYWRNADLHTIEQEFDDQIHMLRKYAKVKRQDIRGLRLPFLQLSGNSSYLVAQKLGLLYDASWPTEQYQSPAMWPYTLDYHSVQDCPIGPCPDASIPGFWINPMVTWNDINGYRCAMLDGCVFPPAGDNEHALFNWMLDNFNRHYENNRAPFGMYLHSAWFARGPKHFSAFRK